MIDPDGKLANEPCDPYRPPTEVGRDPGRQSRSPGSALVLASVLWWAISIKVVALGMLIRPICVDLDVSLPLLTRLLLHPMASVLCVATSIVVILGGLVIDRPAQRIRLGRIALVLGVIAILGGLLGLLFPLVVLLGSLS